jgi:hypothetical protein
MNIIKFGMIHLLKNKLIHKINHFSIKLTSTIEFTWRKKFTRHILFQIIQFWNMKI